MDAQVLKTFISVQFKKTIRGKSPRYKYRFVLLIGFLVFIGYSLGSISRVAHAVIPEAMTFTLMGIFSYLLFYFLTEIAFQIDRKEEIEFIMSLPVDVSYWFMAKAILLIVLGAVVSSFMALGYSIGVGERLANGFLAAFQTGLLSLAFVLIGLSIAIRNRVVIDRALEIGQIFLSILIGIWFIFSDQIKHGLLEGTAGAKWVRYLPFYLLSKAFSNGNIIRQLEYLVVTAAVVFIAGYFFYKRTSAAAAVEPIITESKGKARESGHAMPFQRLPLRHRSPRIAIWKLSLTHITRDRVFRTALFPPMIIYLIILTTFTSKPTVEFQVSLISIVLFTTLLVLGTFLYSSSHEGAWILETAPIERGKIIAYTVEFGVSFLLGSFLLVLLAASAIFSPHTFKQSFSSAAFSWVSALGMGYAFGLIDRKIPFSQGMESVRGPRRLIVIATFPLIAIMVGLWYVFIHFSFPIWGATLAVIMLDFALKKSLEKVRA